MEKKTKKALRLKRESVRRLTSPELTRIAAGIDPAACDNSPSCIRTGGG